MPRAYSTDLASGRSRPRGRRGPPVRDREALPDGERSTPPGCGCPRGGRRAPRPPRGGRPRSAARPRRWPVWWRERNDATLAEYADRLAERTACGAAPSALAGAEGARPGAEEKTLQAADPDREDVASTGPRGAPAGRVEPPASCSSTRPDRHPAMTPAYARAARGERAAARPGGVERLNVISALALDACSRAGRRRRDRHAVFLAFTEEA